MSKKRLPKVQGRSIFSQVVKMFQIGLPNALHDKHLNLCVSFFYSLKLRCTTETLRNILILQDILRIMVSDRVLISLLDLEHALS